MFEKPGDSRPALIDSTVGKYIRTAQQRLAPQPNIAQMQQQAYQTPQEDVGALRGIGEHFTGEGPGSFAYRMYEAFPQDYQPPQPDRAWYDRAAGNVIGAAQRVGSAIGDIPISLYQSPPRMGGQQHDPRGLGESWENTGGRPIPYADKAKRAAEKYGAPVARVMPQTAVMQAIGERLPGVPTPSGVAAGLIPQEMWELALELVPSVGTVPDLIKAVKRGAPDALAALSKVVDGETFERVVRAFADERGSVQFGRDALKAGDDLAGAGDAVQPAADNLPSPPEGAIEAAPNASMVKSEHSELITALGRIVPSKEDRAAQLAAGRARQFGDRRYAIDTALAGGRTAQEAMGSGRGAMAGGLLDRKTLEGVFSSDRVDGYYRDVLDAERAGTITSGESIAVENALDLLTKGARKDGSKNPVMPHEVKAMSRIFGPEIEAVLPATPAQMTVFQKILAPFQIYRSYKTAFDDSFGFGQGWKILAADPKSWIKGKIAGWRGALGNEETAERVMEQLRADSPNFVRGQDAERPLGIMTTGAGTNPAEEFMSPLTEKIPGMSRSERSFVVGGSVMRQRALDQMVLIWEKANPEQSVPDDVFQQMIDIINSGTGWGDINYLGSYAPALQQTAFSMRAKSGLVQYPINLIKAATSGDPTLRRIAAQQFASWMAMNAVVLGAASGVGALAVEGAERTTGAELNPYSPNWGKIVFGKQKIDIWQGYQPIARLIWQLATGKKQPPGYQSPTGVNRFDLPYNYIRAQLSPGATIVNDIIGSGRGRGILGDSVTGKDYWIDAAGPLFVGDAVESLKEYGLLGIPGAALAFEGIRLGTYGESEHSQDASAKDNAANEFRELAKDTDAYVSGGKVRFRTLDEGEKAAVPKIINALSASNRPEGDFDTVSELRSAVVDHLYKDYMTKNKVGAGEAKAQVGNNFDALELVKNVEANIKAYRLNFWKEHPDLLDAAQLASLETLNEAERELLPAKE